MQIAFPITNGSSRLRGLGMMLSVRKTRGWPTLLVAFVLLLGACGGLEEPESSEGGATGAAGAESDAGAEDEATAEGDAGGEEQVLRIGVPRSMAYAMDPLMAPQAAISSPLVNVFDTLVVRDGEEYGPSLATEWENTDELTWVFTLQKGVTFHDGSPLEADDVVASLERFANPESGSGISSLWPLFASAEATDPQTVTITTTEPMGTMLPSLSLMFVAPAEQLAEIGPMIQEEVGSSEVPVGSGPYRLDSHTSESEMILTANEDYWGGAPEIERLEYRYIPEVAARNTALETGELDVTWNVGPDQVPVLEGNDEIVVESPPSYKYYLVWFNAQREQFADARVRQAMNLAVDVDQIITDLFPDYGKRATAPIPETVLGWSGQEPYDYDPERARQLLAEAGYPDGFSVQLQWQQGCCPQIQALADTLISYWAEIGVTVEPTPKENATWGADLISLNYDINLQDNPVITGDADYTLFRLYANNAPDAEAPYNGLVDEELRTLLVSARTTVDQDERQELYDQAIARMWEQGAGLFLLDLPLVYAFRSGIEGIDLDPAERVRFNEATISG